MRWGVAIVFYACLEKVALRLSLHTKLCMISEVSAGIPLREKRERPTVS